MTTEEKIEKAKSVIQASLDIIKQEHGIEMFIGAGVVDDTDVYTVFMKSDGMTDQEAIYGMAGLADTLNEELGTFVSDTQKALNEANDAE